jgi:UDP-N-acetylglucosamine 2-epimerase
MTANSVVDLVAGARPNFMKLAPVKRALRAAGQASPTWRRFRTAGTWL